MPKKIEDFVQGSLDEKLLPIVPLANIVDKYRQDLMDNLQELLRGEHVKGSPLDKIPEEQRTIAIVRQCLDNSFLYFEGVDNGLDAAQVQTALNLLITIIENIGPHEAMTVTDFQSRLLMLLDAPEYAEEIKKTVLHAKILRKEIIEFFASESVHRYLEKEGATFQRPFHLPPDLDAELHNTCMAAVSKVREVPDALKKTIVRLGLSPDILNKDDAAAPNYLEQTVFRRIKELLIPVQDKDL